MTVHVVHLVASFDTGGLQNGIVNLANHMDPDRVRHTVLSFSPRVDLASRLLRADVHSLGLDGGAHRDAWRTVAEKLRDLKPDILHTRNQATWADGIRAARRARVRHRIHGFHGRDQSQLDGMPLSRRLLGRVLASATDQLMTLTASMREEFSRDFFISPERIKVIANGLDLERFAPRAPQQSSDGQSFCVATLGRFADVKNLPLLLRAFSAMNTRRDDDKLLLAGDGGARDTLQALAAELGIADSVEFLGMLQDPAPVYERADVYVQPSFYEGMSNTIVEAMASGVPVVATDVGGNADVLGRDGGSGVLVPTDDISALARALDRLRCDAAERYSIAVAGQGRALKQFGLERMVDAYLETYESMVGAK